MKTHVLKNYTEKLGTTTSNPYHPENIIDRIFIDGKYYSNIEKPTIQKVEKWWKLLNESVNTDNYDFYIVGSFLFVDNPKDLDVVVTGEINDNLGLILKTAQEIGGDLNMYVDIFHKTCADYNPYEDYILRCLGKRKESTIPKDYKIIKHYYEKRLVCYFSNLNKCITIYKFCNGEKIGENLYIDYPYRWEPKITEQNTKEVLMKKFKYLHKPKHIKYVVNEYKNIVK